MNKTIPILLMLVLALPVWAADYTLTINATNGWVVTEPNTATFAEGTVVKMYPLPFPGYCFDNWTGDLTSIDLLGQITMDGNKEVTANFKTWVHPAGIPNPPFGIFETYRGYDEGGVYTRSTVLTYRASAAGGFFTHYVDNTAGGATDGTLAGVSNGSWNHLTGVLTKAGAFTSADIVIGDQLRITGGTGMTVGYYAITAKTNDTVTVGTAPNSTTDPTNVMASVYNTCGTLAKPRLTVPTDLPPGSVCEIRGGPYAYGGTSGGYHIIWFTALGTAAQPCFIRGIWGSQPVWQTTTIQPGGSYLIIENIHGDNVRILFHKSRGGDHFGIRNCEIHGLPPQAGLTCCAAERAKYVVAYSNYFHDNGDLNHDHENDVDGFNMAFDPVTHEHGEYYWIVDNHSCRHGGDSVLIESGISSTLEVDINHVYVGRNIFHEDAENAVDMKQVNHMIVSQNTFFGYHPTPWQGSGSDGTAVIVNDEWPQDNIWIIQNKIFNSTSGIRSQQSNGVYILNNEIHNVHADSTPYGNYASYGIISYAGCTMVNVVCNTIYDCDTGIYLSWPGVQPNTYGLNLYGNIISKVSSTSFNHISLTETAMAANSHMDYNLLYQPGGSVRIRWGTPNVESLSTFQTRTGEGLHCIEADPKFLAPDVNNLTLQATSPAVDTGTEPNAYQTFYDLYGIDIRKDIKGRPRPQGDAWDIGAYEYVVEPIGDLSVSATSQNSVTLGWMVPGEEGVTGTPNLYDIRYAGSAITEANWDVATQIQGEPVPGGFGTQQSFTITGLNPGATYYIAMKVGDEVGHFSQLSNVVPGTTATSGNHAPALTPIGDRSVAETGTLTFLVSATDADGDPLTYSATGLPAGADFTSATRTFTWTPTNLQSGRYRVMFQVSDTHVTVSETITITVREGSNEAPVLGAIGDKSTDENELLSFSVSATDEDGDSLTLSATGLPSGATLVGGAFTWTPNYSQAGSYQVTFTVSDGELTDSEQITITVANVTDQTAPVADEVFPPPDAVQVPVNPVITFALTDLGLGIDPNTVALRVSDQLVYTGNNILYNSPDGICRRTGNPMNYRYYFFPNDPFDFDQPVPVLVNASDLAHNAMTPLSYQFVTEMRSFGQNQLVSSNTGSSGHPAIATDSHGNLWGAWHTGQAGSGDIYVAKRGNDAQQWAAPFRLTNLDSDQRNPAMAIGSNDTLYVTWQDNRRGNWDIYVAVSLDGVTWNDPVRLTDPNTNETNPAIAIDRASPNRVYIAWQQDEGAGNQDIYVASSSTRFISKAVTQVTSQAASQTEPALAVGSDNTAYLVWTDRRNGSADIYGSSSSAVSWANVAIVTGAGNQSNPAIAVGPESSSLHVLWVSDTTGNLDVVGGVANGLPGAPISGSVVVDDTTGADQSAPAVLAVKDHWNRSHIYACWQDNRSVADSGDSDLYFAEIRSGAAGTNILVGDDGANSNQSDPALGFDRYGEPVVLWVDDRGSTAQIYGACSTYPDPVALASGTIPSSTGGRVGPDPASIGHDSDVSIGIASNALGCDALLAISKLQNAQAFGAPCLASYEISPSGIQFSPPATVVIPYMASGSGPATPYWYDAQTGMLSQLGITDIARTTLPNGLSVVSFNTTHLTSFYVLEGSSVVNGVGGGGGGCALSRAREGSVVGYFLPYGALALLLFVRRWMDGRRKGDSERASAS